MTRYRALAAARPFLGEGRGRAAMLVQLNAPAVEFDLVQPLLTAPWRRT
jgi:hypothetical protein